MFADSLARIRCLFLKEIATLFGDKKRRVVLFIPPIIQLVMFAFALSQEITNVPIVMYNQDVGIEGETLAKLFLVKPTFREIIRVDSYRDLNRAIEDQRALGAIVVPQDFSRKMSSPTETATVQLTLDGRRANGAAVLGGYATQIVAAYGASASWQNASSSLRATPQGVVSRRWFNPNLVARNAFLPGLVCIIMTTVGMITSATSIASEREFGSFEQLVVSPFSPLEIVVGKMLAGVALATVSALAILAVVVWGFKQPLLGSFWLFLLSTILYLTSIVCVGLFISSLSTTQQQATLGMFLFLPPAIMLSGYATPLENMPVFLQRLTVGNPVRWEIIALKGILSRGATTSSVLLNLVPLAIVAAITFAVAVHMFKRRME